MPENLKALRRRIRSVKNTRQITRAMEMVSASKLKRAEAALAAAKPYSERLSEMLRRLVAAGDVPDNPLFETRQVVRARLVVVFAADRGLCGAYNNNLLKNFELLAKQSAAQGVALRALPVGRRASEHLHRKMSEVPLADDNPSHGGIVTVELAHKIAEAAIEDFTKGRCDEVVFLYNRFVSTSKYEINEQKFLPFDLDALSGGRSADAGGADSTAAREYIYEPDAKTVFESLLPRFIQSKVYVALASAMASEHAARMLAMNAATKNCGELIDKLTLRLNKARQAQITTEIIEIVSGAEAINA